MLLFNFILGEILFPLCLGDKIEPQQVYWVVCSLKKLDSHLLHLRALNTGKTGLSMHGHYCLGDEHLSTCLTHIS